MSAPSKEQRAAPRLRLRLQVRYWNPELESLGYTSDISRSGLFLQTRRPIEVGTRLHLELALPGGPFFAEGLVTRIVQASSTVQSVARAGAGVRFVSLMEVVRSMAQSASQHPDDLLEIQLPDAQRIQQLWERELAHGGVFVPTEQALPRDALVLVRFVLPAPHEAVEVKGKVVHVNPAPRGVAIQLDDVERLRVALRKVAPSL